MVSKYLIEKVARQNGRAHRARGLLDRINGEPTKAELREELAQAVRNTKALGSPIEEGEDHEHRS